MGECSARPQVLCNLRDYPDEQLFLDFEFPILIDVRGPTQTQGGQSYPQRAKDESLDLEPNSREPAITERTD